MRIAVAGGTGWTGRLAPELAGPEEHLRMDDMIRRLGTPPPERP